MTAKRTRAPGGGRKPKPVALKELAGNPGKRALNKDQPRFTPLTNASMPDYFIEDGMSMAAVMWDVTVKELCGQGVLCVTDLSVLERWCVGYEVWRRAVKSIITNGTTLTAENGNAYANPDVVTKAKQEAVMATAGALLGLDPSSRQRLIGAAGQAKATNPFIRLITS